MEFNLKVTQELLNIIIEGLDEIPTKKGMPAKIEILKQVDAFNKEAKAKEDQAKKAQEKEAQEHEGKPEFEEIK